MDKPFSLSHIDLAHAYWERILEPGDWAIDATCGNGHDTLFLANHPHVEGVIALDIQPAAIQSAKERVLHSSKVHFFEQSHETFPTITTLHPIRLIVYNLGYLPKGNKAITTEVSSTLTSLRRALSLLSQGGLISLTCYPGHEEGKRELLAIEKFLHSLPMLEWDILKHTKPNKPIAPVLIVLKKSVSLHRTPV